MNSFIKAQNQLYLPGLNGLRAIAAIAVVISHITNMLNWFGLKNQVNGLGSEVYKYKFGEYGVTIFFTLILILLLHAVIFSATFNISA